MSGPGGASRGSSGNHALLDYETQLRLLEQQNKNRLMMRRQEQDTMMPGPEEGRGLNVSSAEDITAPFGQSTASRSIGELDPESAKSIPQNEAGRDTVHSVAHLRVESSDEDDEGWLEINRRRVEERRKRRNLGNLQKRTISQSIGSDTDEEDAHPALLESRDGLTGGTRRLRRKAKDKETSLRFEGKLSEMGGNGEGGVFSERTVGLSGIHETNNTDDERNVEAYEQRERELDQQRFREVDGDPTEIVLDSQRVLDRAIASSDVDNNSDERRTYAPTMVRGKIVQKLQPVLLSEKDDDQNSETQQLELGEEEAVDGAVDPSETDEPVVVPTPDDTDTQATSSDLQMHLKSVKIYEMVKDAWVERGIGFCVLLRTRVSPTNV